MRAISISCLPEGCMLSERVISLQKYNRPAISRIACMSPHFVVHRVVVQVAQQVDFHCDSFVIVVCLWGNANINGIDIRQGETILVPASENVLYIFGNATFLTATMP